MIRCACWHMLHVFSSSSWQHVPPWDVIHQIPFHFVPLCYIYCILSLFFVLKLFLIRISNQFVCAAGNAASIIVIVALSTEYITMWYFVFTDKYRVLRHRCNTMSYNKCSVCFVGWTINNHSIVPRLSHAQFYRSFQASVHLRGSRGSDAVRREKLAIMTTILCYHHIW